jgi:hypothetical protein
MYISVGAVSYFLIALLWLMIPPTYCIGPFSRGLNQVLQMSNQTERLTSPPKVELSLQGDNVKNRFFIGWIALYVFNGLTGYLIHHVLLGST